jgi:hypothetical protein
MLELECAECGDDPFRARSQLFLEWTDWQRLTPIPTRLNSRASAPCRIKKPKRPRHQWRSALWLAVIVTGLGTQPGYCLVVVPGTDTPMSMSALG